MRSKISLKRWHGHSMLYTGSWPDRDDTIRAVPVLIIMIPHVVPPPSKELSSDLGLISTSSPHIIVHRYVKTSAVLKQKLGDFLRERFRLKAYGTAIHEGNPVNDCRLAKQ
ncbi:unnamed protein product [Clonostachys solani]|uniref:Uncharacterized protein n=1 Tax=Clonostachys solani TaxID=160281 RepID=A0A9P0EP58_9HYPO|nr:unnamed protein product [Clonostachys solani]